MSGFQSPLSRSLAAIHQVTAGALPCLAGIQGLEAGRLYYLTADIVTIGHGSANDVQLWDWGVAARHAGIRRQRAGTTYVCQIYDLGSLFGVQVNGVPITMRHPLTPGDRITLGNAVLEFFIPSR